MEREELSLENFLKAMDDRKLLGEKLSITPTRIIYPNAESRERALKLLKERGYLPEDFV